MGFPLKSRHVMVPTVPNVELPKPPLPTFSALPPVVRLLKNSFFDCPFLRVMEILPQILFLLYLDCVPHPIAAPKLSSLDLAPVAWIVEFLMVMSPHTLVLSFAIAAPIPEPPVDPVEVTVAFSMVMLPQVLFPPLPMPAGPP